MQVTDQDIRGMAESLAAMYEPTRAIVFIAPAFSLNPYAEKVWECMWHVMISSGAMLVNEKFKTWDELRAWARTQDADYEETILIQEVA